MNSPAPGWFPDPTTRHQYRYWDGGRWTDDVADDGVTSTDPIGQAGPPGTDPTAPVGPYPGAPADPTQQYPTAGPGGPQYGGYDGGSPQPPPVPAKKGPSAGLLAIVAVVAVALIGGLVYFLVDAMATSMEQAAGGALTHEQAVCASEGLLDELGLSEMIDMSESGTNPFTDREMASRLLEIFDHCGVSPEALAGADEG